MIEKNFDKNNENCIEWLTGQRFITITATERKMINRLKKLYTERKDEFISFTENKDGSVCAKIPRRWEKINAGAKPDAPKKKISEEQKVRNAARLAEYREKNKSNKLK